VKVNDGPFEGFDGDGRGSGRGQRSRLKVDGVDLSAGATPVDLEFTQVSKTA
jgi:transcription antitermination factor NusG